VRGGLRLVEDGLVVGTLALAVAHPWLVLGLGVGMSLLLAVCVTSWRSRPISRVLFDACAPRQSFL